MLQPLASTASGVVLQPLAAQRAACFAAAVPSDRDRIPKAAEPLQSGFRTWGLRSSLGASWSFKSSPGASDQTRSLRSRPGGRLAGAAGIREQPRAVRLQPLLTTPLPDQPGQISEGEWRSQPGSGSSREQRPGVARQQNGHHRLTAIAHQPKTSRTPAGHQPDTNRTATRHQPDTNRCMHCFA